MVDSCLLLVHFLRLPSEDLDIYLSWAKITVWGKKSNLAEAGEIGAHVHITTVYLEKNDLLLFSVHT